MSKTDQIEKATAKFKELLVQQLERAEAIKKNENVSPEGPVVIGVVPGDGIGPSITKQAERILAFLLEEDIASGKVIINNIEGLTLENRVACHAAIPPEVLAQIKDCTCILKGPTTTPDAGSNAPNLESANVAMRKSLDLFANVRPVKVEEENIDWTLFRENTEGAYAVGSMGVDVDGDLAVDFTVATTTGCERIIRQAFEFAAKNGKKRVTAVTKANIIKTTDGKFLKIFREIAAEYPNITADDWYIDIMTAKLLDKARRSQFEVMVLPNLYGDILSDEAAEIQGGVGTAGSANIGSRYAMFEAIHGSAPRMVQEGRADYADPCSIIRAASMLLRHIGYADKAERLDAALHICMQTEKRVVITGRADGATGAAWADYVMETIKKIND